MKWRGLEESKAGQHAATLREELEERKALAEQYVPREVQEVNQQTVEGLRASGMAQKILGVGAEASSFELPDQDGNMLSSCSLLSRGRLVICFFRGRWCPFCVAQLEAMNSALADIQKAGGSLLAISPQTVKQSFFMRDQHQLRFPLLSDSHNHVARGFGLVYPVPEEQKAVYSRTFVNLPFLNEDSSWELPIPATYIVARDGAVLFASADPDYTRRPEPAEILRHLRDAGGDPAGPV
ncbi:MAG TPA: peroxiredoxin-like family protein [Terriglobales bacterium]|nr:peroxiredoxin-like family protein [Terriglobales bacterium]